VRKERKRGEERGNGHVRKIRTEERGHSSDEASAPKSEGNRGLVSSQTLTV